MVKTTLELPDPLFRLVKAKAALRGVSLRQYVTEALEDKVRGRGAIEESAPAAVEPPWMRGYGALSDLRDETRRIEGLIAEEFGKVEPEDAE